MDQIAVTLAAERAITKNSETLRVLENLTHSIADVFAQADSTFDRDSFYAQAEMTK